MSLQPLRIGFFGSPAFAVPVLEALARQHDVALVVAQPDKPAGRGMALHTPAAARRAHELGLALAQPGRLKGNAAFHEQLAALELDVAVTAAYGRILPGSLLGVPQHGFLNVHASLLPKYRGAAPVQWALIQGETETGVTIMQTDVGLDTGPIRLQRRIAIQPADDAVTLLDKLSTLGATALLEALGLLAEGTLPRTEQDDAAATLAPPLRPEDGWVRWGDDAHRIVDRHRGVALWPGGSFEHEGQRVKLEAVRAADALESGAPGTVLATTASGLIVAAGRGAVELLRVKPPGKRAMGARDWANGRGVKRGVRLG